MSFLPIVVYTSSNNTVIFFSPSHVMTQDQKAKKCVTLGKLKDYQSGACSLMKHQVCDKAGKEIKNYIKNKI